MARLYSNENFPQPAVEALRGMGHDVLTSFEAGNANLGIPDADVVRAATMLGRALVTLNRRDFVRLHTASQQHGGIVVCTADRDFQGLATRIDSAISSVNPTDGHLYRVNLGSYSVD